MRIEAVTMIIGTLLIFCLFDLSPGSPHGSSSTMNPWYTSNTRQSKGVDYSSSWSSSPPSLPQLAEVYIRVSRKMDIFCSQPFEEERDSKLIDMYSLCFSNLIQADKDIVRDCRQAVYRSGKGMKEADCSSHGWSESKSEKVRECITMRMINEKDANYYYRDSDEGNDLTIQIFVNCVDGALP